MRDDYQFHEGRCVFCLNTFANLASLEFRERAVSASDFSAGKTFLLSYSLKQRISPTVNHHQMANGGWMESVPISPPRAINPQQKEAAVANWTSLMLMTQKAM
jgi:hypothetical protein